MPLLVGWFGFGFGVKSKEEGIRNEVDSLKKLQVTKIQVSAWDRSFHTCVVLHHHFSASAPKEKTVSFPEVSFPSEPLVIYV